MKATYDTTSTVEIMKFGCHMYLLMYTLFMSDCNFVKERNNMLENNLKLDMPDKDIIELIKIYLTCLIYEKKKSITWIFRFDGYTI